MPINKRKIQEVNAGSMADISFLLLIFFLVATTMSTDSGILRVLPPWVENVDADKDILERNLILVQINQQNKIMAGGREVHITEVKDIVKDFVTNREGDPNKPEKKVTEIELFGNYPVSQAVISLQNDRGTSYETYIMVQNELQRAINEIRNEISLARYQTEYNRLDDDRQQAVRKAQPTAISEAVPRDIGGN